MKQVRWSGWRTEQRDPSGEVSYRKCTEENKLLLVLYIVVSNGLNVKRRFKITMFFHKSQVCLQIDFTQA